LRHAEALDPEALPAALQRRAFEELRMLSQTDLERERYEARRKALLDYKSGLKAARLEGLAEGRSEGEKIGAIHALERLLKRPEPPTEQLAAMTPEELTRLAGALQEQFQVNR
jgi:flagellar biosynthesis/type III secretory pathway protein FliH